MAFGRQGIDAAASSRRQDKRHPLRQEVVLPVRVASVKECVMKIASAVLALALIALPAGAVARGGHHSGGHHSSGHRYSGHHYSGGGHRSGGHLGSGHVYGFATSKCKSAACFRKHPDGTWVHPLTTRKRP